MALVSRRQLLEPGIRAVIVPGINRAQDVVISSGSDLYVGGSNVTDANGFYVPGGREWRWRLVASEDLVAVSPGGADVSILSN